MFQSIGPYNCWHALIRFDTIVALSYVTSHIKHSPIQNSRYESRPMVAAPFVKLGLIEVMMLLSGGGLLGMPPGERVPAMLRSAPSDALIYYEWAPRGAGKAGAAGVDGLVADPEIQAFVADVERAVMAFIDAETDSGEPEEQILGQALPPLVKSLLNHTGAISVALDANALKLDASGPERAPPGDTPPKDASANNSAQQAAAQAGQWVAFLPALKVTLVIDAGTDADAFAGYLEKLLQLLPAKVRSKDLQRQVLPMPIPGVELTLHRDKTRFIVGLGQGTVDAALARLAGTAKGLDSNTRFSDAMKQTAYQRTASVTWVDVKGIVTQATQAMGLQGAMVAGMVKLVGADSIDSFASVTGVVDGSVRTRSLLNNGGRTDGIMALAAGRAIVAEDLKLIPADADFVTAFSLSAPKILTAAKSVIGSIDPGSESALQEWIAQLEKEVGVSLENDIFPAFGDVWTLQDSPAAGGVFFSSLVASLEVRDPQKAYAVFTKLMAVLKEALPGETRTGFRRHAVFLAQKKFMDRTIYYVNTIGADVPVAPAFCITDRQLLFALHPQALKSQLRFLNDTQPDAKLDTSFAAKLGTEIPQNKGDLLSVSYFDSKAFIRYIYAAAPYFGQVLASQMQSSGVAFDVFSLPSARAVLPYMKNSFSTATRTKNGILIESQSGVPFVGSSGGTFVFPFLMMSGSRLTRLR